MTVSLRPYRVDEFEQSLVMRGIEDDESRERWQKNFDGSGTWVDHYLHLAIDVDGLMVGDLQLRRCHATMPPGVLEVGLEILEDWRGKGVGTASLICAADKFLNQEFHRICGSTDVENMAMIRVFEKANWTKEGILRGLFSIDNQIRDYVSYSIIRGDVSAK